MNSTNYKNQLVNQILFYVYMFAYSILQHTCIIITISSSQVIQLHLIPVRPLNITIHYPKVSLQYHNSVFIYFSNLFFTQNKSNAHKYVPHIDHKYCFKTILNFGSHFEASTVRETTNLARHPKCLLNPFHVNHFTLQQTNH